MTTISGNSAISSYLGLASRNSPAASANSVSSGTEKSADTSTGTSQDAVADLRRYANALIAQSRGGLFRAMSGGTALGASPTSGTQAPAQPPQGGEAQKIELPDVAELDRDEALKLKDKVQKLIDAGFDEKDSGLGFVGYDGDKQTNSLTTYRDWLQAKGGVSIYV